MTTAGPFQKHSAMQGKTKTSVSKLQWYYTKLRKGLFLHGLRNRLARIGIDIEPFYWVEEEVEPCPAPHIKGDASIYTVKILEGSKLDAVKHMYSEDEYRAFISGAKEDHLCVYLECDKKIVAYTFIEFNKVSHKKRVFNLKDDEAYLFKMETRFSHRGKNLAPYLRYQAYKLLKEKGVKRKYSITSYFNKSSIRFKKKLNSQHRALYMGIVIFNKYFWNVKLRSFNA